MRCQLCGPPVQCICDHLLTIDNLSDIRCMLEAQGVVLPLRVLLVLLFGVLVVFQTMSLPGQFAYMAQEDPEHAYLRWPATVVTVFWVLCIQMVIVSTWKLLTLVKNDRISPTPHWRG